MAFSVPDGTTCTGTMNGIENVCLAKIANSNKAGPFGGVVPFQIVNGSPAAPAAPAATSAVPAAAAAKSTKGSKNARRAVAFSA
jgi:Egh16-like virulence factor